MLSWECKRCLKEHCLLNEFIRDWCYLYITDYQHIPNSYVSWVFIWEMSKHPVLYVATLSVAKQRPGRALLHPPVPGFNLVSGPLTQFTAAVLIKNVQHKCVTFSWLLTWTKHRRWLPLFWQWNEMVIFLFRKKKKEANYFSSMLPGLFMWVCGRCRLCSSQQLSVELNYVFVFLRKQVFVLKNGVSVMQRFKEIVILPVTLLKIAGLY